MESQKTQFSFIISDFNTKIGKTSIGMTALRNFGIDTQNVRGGMFIGFAEENNLKMMNIFFDRKASMKWTWKSLNCETKNEISFIHTNKFNTVMNVTVLNKSKLSDHKIVRCKVMLDLKREREKLFRMNKYSQLADEVNE